MNINWTFVLSVIGLAFIFEGIPYFIFAERMPKLLRSLAEQHPRVLRTLGLSVILLGLALIWIARRSS